MSVQQNNFTAIADAIRTKKGTTELIKPSDFADEILTLPSGGGTQIPVSAFMLPTITGTADLDVAYSTTLNLADKSTFAPNDTIAINFTIKNRTNARKWLRMQLSESELFGRNVDATSPNYVFDGNYVQPTWNAQKDELENVADFNDVLMFVTYPTPKMYPEYFDGSDNLLSGKPSEKETYLHQTVNVEYDRTVDRNGYVHATFPKSMETVMGLPKRVHTIFDKPIESWVETQNPDLSAVSAADCYLLEPNETVKFDLGIRFSKLYTIRDESKFYLDAETWELFPIAGYEASTFNYRYIEDDLNVFQKKYFRFLQIDIKLLDM